MPSIRTSSVVFNFHRRLCKNKLWFVGRDEKRAPPKTSEWEATFQCRHTFASVWGACFDELTHVVIRVSSALDCKTVCFFFLLKISKEIGKVWRKSVTRAKPTGVWGERKKTRLSPVSLSVFSLVLDLLFDCSRVLEYAKIRTVLQSTSAFIFQTFAEVCHSVFVKRSTFKTVLNLRLLKVYYRSVFNESSKAFIFQKFAESLHPE